MGAGAVSCCFWVLGGVLVVVVGRVVHMSRRLSALPKRLVRGSIPFLRVTGAGAGGSGASGCCKGDCCCCWPCAPSPASSFPVHLPDRPDSLFLNCLGCCANCDAGGSGPSGLPTASSLAGDDGDMPACPLSLLAQNGRFFSATAADGDGDAPVSSVALVCVRESTIGDPLGVVDSDVRPVACVPPVSICILSPPES